MRRHIRIATGAGALVLLLTAGAAIAHHFNLLGNDDRFQRAGFAGPENWTFFWWARTHSSMWWWAEANLDADTTQAVNGLAAATGMPFLEVNSQAAADVAVVEDNSLSAFGLLDLTEIFAPAGSGGNYSFRARAVIRNSGTVPVGSGWPATIAHEIAHFIGLHERYRDSGSAGPWCNAEVTIMNSGSCATRPAAPSALDVDRIDGMYREGDLPAMTAAVSGTTYELSWEDAAWGERAHELYFHYWDPAAGWQVVERVDHRDQIGMRETSFHTRTLTRSWNRSSFGRPAGWYCGCGWTVHIRGGPGPWRCGTVSWVG